MHPNPAFRPDPGLGERALLEALIDEIGFGMVFAATPDGPRVAHTPLLSTDDGAVQFHLARGNGLTRWLAGETALVVVNGPDAYVSPRFGGAGPQVPTWNYIAVELEGRVRQMSEEGLLGLLEALSARHEGRIEGAPWTMADMPEAGLRRLLGGITGFELEIEAWRPTFKLSQNKPAAERAQIAAALEAAGSPAVAELMRRLVP